MCVCVRVCVCVCVGVCMYVCIRHVRFLRVSCAVILNCKLSSKMTFANFDLLARRRAMPPPLQSAART